MTMVNDIYLIEVEKPLDPPNDCTDRNMDRCPNMKEWGNSFVTENYKCDVCGRYYRLYYDDMS